MSQLKVSFACGLYDRMLALYTGEVRPVGIDLNFLAIDSPRDIFDRMGGGLEFDACEMSSSEYISRLAGGDCPLVAIPVFPSRVFRHSFICVNRKAGIKSAKDLEGKRVGVPLYTMTAAVFIRGLLQHEYGVDLSRIQWVQGAINSAGAHGRPSAPPLLRPVHIEINDSGKSLNQLLVEGKIDAIAGTSVPAAIRTNPDIVRLFPNYREVEKQYYKRTGIFPIMHLVVIRRELYQQHRFVASSLYEAMCDAKKIALSKMRYAGATRYMLPWLSDDLEEIDQLFGADPWPYGIEANRPTLEALVNYLVEQGLIDRPLPLDQIFVPTYGERHEGL
ncbi:MAG TPA: ABC transporter substrate-binding protein [Candidatus Binataceae bacterium]|nr:ABC transporter substrate-binding protein [Candidatus Binataceae bacterium]